MNTKEDLQWLASVLDVQGTIGVQNSGSSRKKRCKRADGKDTAIVQLTSREGSVEIVRAKRVMGAKAVLIVTRHSTYKTDRRVTVCGKRAAAVLRAVLPYMREPSRIALAKEAVALEDCKASERRFGPESGDKCDACPSCNDDWPKPFEEEKQWLGDPAESPSEDPLF